MKKHIAGIILIAAVGLLVYSSTFDVPFQFDDESNITENPAVTDFGNVGDYLPGGDVYAGTPLKMRLVGYFSFALNYRLHGPDVTGYHIVNLFIHILNAILVYLLVLMTFRTPYMKEGEDGAFPGVPVAFFSALLFVSHPVQTQAVTYIVQRLASLAAMFYLISLAAYVKSRLIQMRSGGTVTASCIMLYSVSIISAVLAMKTKSIAFTLPLIAVLYEFFFFTGKRGKRLLYLAPLLLTLFIIPLSLVDIDRPVAEIVGDVGETTRLESQMPRLDYLFTQFRVIVTYIRLIFIPVNQNLLYDYPVYHSFFNVNVLLSFVFLLLLFGLAVYLVRSSGPSGRARRIVSFGILWFFITLSVESGIIPIAHVIFEHRVYLPSAGAFIAITTAVVTGIYKFRDSRPRVYTAGIAALVVLAGVFSAAAYMRNNVWRSELSLWEDVVEKSPHHEIALTNLGNAYIKSGRLNEAVDALGRAVSQAPNYAKAHYNLGFAYALKGRFDMAETSFKNAVDIRPDYGKAYNNLGMINLQRGDLDRAAEYFHTSAELEPANANAWYNMGTVYSQKEQFEKAAEYFGEAISRKPGYYQAHYNLGNVFFVMGKTEEAISQFERAVEIRPGYARAHYNLGVAYMRKGMSAKAEEHFRKAGVYERNE